MTQAAVSALRVMSTMVRKARLMRLGEDNSRTQVDGRGSRPRLFGERHTTYHVEPSRSRRDSLGSCIRERLLGPNWDIFN
jgi:hypothetical protein